MLKNGPSITNLELTWEVSPFCHSAEVIRAIKGLNRKDSARIDDIREDILKQLNDELAIPIAYLMNQILNKGVYPDLFKHTHIITIPQQGCTQNRRQS